MKIAIGSDHQGFKLKVELKKKLQELNYEVSDFGCFSEDSCDYPDYAVQVAEAVANGDYSRGILVCKTGIGMSIAANKVPGVLAALVCDEEMAKLASEHNNANIICLNSNLNQNRTMKIVTIWLNTPFGWERHLRRINKIKEIENKYLKQK
ncbi:ribose 5-phosphate isomerase B [bacterium]|nr:ribose 5-phosphate isomerase B [bacterium]